MKSKFLRFSRLSLPVLLSLILIFILSSPALAAGTFINYDDYASYSVRDSGSGWNVSATFPRDWFGTRVWTSDWGKQIGYYEDDPSFEVTIPVDSGNTWCLQISPLGGMLGGHIDVGSDLSSGTKILDLSLIPDNTAFIFRFVFDYGGEVSLQAAGTASFRVACVDSSGVVTSIYSFDMTPVLDGSTITYSGSFTPNYYDDSAAGIVPFFYIVNQGVVWPQDSTAHTISVSYDYFRLSFNISDAIKQAQDDSRSQKMLSNIESALEDQGKTLDEVLASQDQTNDLLDDAIHGDADSVSPDGGDIVGDVDDLEDELFDSVSGGLDAADSIFSSSSSFLYSLAPAFVFVSSMCNDLWSFGPFDNLLQVSLGLGIGAAILGLGLSALRSRSQSRSHGYSKAKNKGE